MLRLRWLAALLALALADLTMAQPTPLQQASATVLTRADRTLLLDVARAGSRLVAVGERGVVWLSDDAGASWRAQRTPTTRTLTMVAFSSAATGVAVGHGGTVLRTTDGGASWSRIEVADAGSDSLLGVTWLGDTSFAAYGGFGLYLVSQDGGVTWHRHRIIEADFDRHVSKVLAAGRRYLLAGESSALAVSDDAIEWKRMVSPYKGSWFGALRTSTGALVLYGMRGHVYRSEDGGTSWSASELKDERSVMAGCQLDDGRIVLVGTAGLLTVSGDDGRTFAPVPAPAGGDFAQVVPVGGGRLVLVGDQGVGHATLPSTSAVPAPSKKSGVVLK